MKIKTVLTTIFVLFIVQSLPAQSIDNLIGKFNGEWTAFKRSAEGEIVKSTSWKDVVTAENPQTNETSTFVQVKCQMTFDNPRIPPYQLEFQEGFDIVNGKLTDHFIKVRGVKLLEKKINENTYIISQRVDPTELAQLGFANAIEAYHTTTKLILNVDGKETHKITRLSTIVWKEGSETKTKQFVSLEGYHQRQ